MKLKQQIQNTLEKTEIFDIHGRRIRSDVINEWRASGVHDDITRLNVIYLSGTEPYEYLLFDLPPNSRRNDGRLRDRWLYRYEHCNYGGWWCSGINILTGEISDWGQFKPDRPFIKGRGRKLQLNKGFKGFSKESEKKPIKYESPVRVPTEIYALRVPLHIWEKVAKVNNVPIPANIVVDERTGEAKGFWSWVLANPSISIIITEGAKKAGALLTKGIAAVALPGIWSGLRNMKDQFGNRTEMSFLIPHLKAFAVKGREVNFCFDNDSKPKTKRQVKKAIVKTGKLFEKEGCTVKVISWTSTQKGIDDFIVTHGESAFEAVYDARQPLSKYKLLSLLDLSRLVSLTINQRFLDQNLEAPEDAQIIGIKSPKNTMKTAWLMYQVQKALKAGIKVVVVTHRIQLARALAKRFGIAHIEEIQGSLANENAFTLCIDSLHPDSKAQFNPEEWLGATIIVDEAEQVFWHALSSHTLRKKRVKVLETLELLIKIALGTGGKIYLADADLSPIAIKYVQKLAPHDVRTWIVENTCNPNLGKRKVYIYRESDPKVLVTDLIAAIEKGHQPLVHTSGQKDRSTWGSVNLEDYISKELKKRGLERRILRIDAVSTSDPQHPAYGCTGNLDEIIANYDIVIASPTIETGISIEIENHFHGVWCIAWGNQTVDGVCQAVERLRTDVPRYLWARTVGMDMIGNRSTNPESILASTHKQTRHHIAYLQKAGFNEFGSLDFHWQQAHLLTWAQRAAIVNATKYKYRESIIDKLKDEGYQIVEVTSNQVQTEIAEQVKLELIANKEANYNQHCQDISESVLVDSFARERLEQKQSLTKTERDQLAKAKISQRYCTDHVTPELVKKDDSGWYYQLLLHYYFTVGNQFLADRDAAKLEALSTEKKAPLKSDINQTLFSVRINGFEVIGMKQFFKPGAVFSDRTLKDWHQFISGPMLKQNIKEIYGVNICQAGGGIAQANKLLNKMDLKLVQCGWAGGKKDGHRLYKLVTIDHDGRAAVFGKWLERDLNYNCDPNTALYLGELLANPSNGSLNNKMLLEIAAAGGKYLAPPRQSTVEEHSIEDCAWLLCQIQKFLQSHRDPSGWLEFFESVEATFFAATWDYIAKFKGIDFVRDLASKILAKGGEKAVVATQVAF